MKGQKGPYQNSTQLEESKAPIKAIQSTPSKGKKKGFDLR